MTDDQPLGENSNPADAKEHPEAAAAEGRSGENDKHEQDGTDNETLDTGEHSDAPGPFGTG